MWKKIGIGVGVVLIILVIVVAMKPSEFKIERSAQIAAPAAVVFAQVEDFHKWKAWSPWAKMDPQATNTFEGPDKGVGASMSWEGKESGAGKMTVVESTPPTFLKLNLEFTKPWKAINVTEISLQPGAQGTTAHWVMTGKTGFIGKFFCLFMNMDKLVGGDFEKALQGIKEISEAQVAKKH